MKEAYLSYYIQETNLKNEDSEALQKQRTACGMSHSWENNVKEIYKYIDAFEKGWPE